MSTYRRFLNLLKVKREIKFLKKNGGLEDERTLKIMKKKIKDI